MMKQTPEQRAEPRNPRDAVTTRAMVTRGEWMNAHRQSYATCIREEVEPRDETIERLRALVQRLMDRSADVIARWDSPKWKWDQHTGELITELRIEVEAARSQGFVPTNTESE